jgi:hypothetical protein
VDLRDGLDDVENRKFLTLPGLELRPLCLPARSQSLYRLNYPGVQKNDKLLQFTEVGSAVTFGATGNKRFHSGGFLNGSIASNGKC